MSFLTKEDYLTQIRDLRLTQMTENTSAILTNVSSEAVAFVKGYLFTLYDVQTIFSQVGANRDTLIMYHTKNIALYILHQRLPNAMIPPYVQANYDNTVQYLNDIAKGKIAIDLPKKQVDSNGDGLADTSQTVFKWGGRKAHTH